MQDLFLSCKDWPFQNMFLNQMKNRIICQKETQRQMQEECVAFFFRHIVLNGSVWLKQLCLRNIMFLEG